MKIECDKCQAKYSIADEKVRGKTFKIRCKKCSNVIIVRDKTGGGSDLNLGAAASGAGSDGTAVWHVAIDGETVGPLSEQEVRRRFESGEIDQHTSVWQEGFEDWVELRTVDNFSDLAPKSASLFGDSLGGSLGASLGGRDDVSGLGLGQASGLSSSPSLGSGGGELQFGSSPAGSNAPASPRVTELTGQRNENSVLFSLENLQKLASGGGGAAPTSEAQRSSLSAPSTSVPTSEGSGLIDIRSMGVMLENQGAKEPRRSDEDVLPSFGGSGFGGLAAQPLVAEGPPVGTYGAVPQAQPRSTTPVVVAVVVVGFAIAGAVFFGLRQQPAVQPNPSAMAVAPKLDELDGKSKDGKSALVVPSKDDEASEDEKSEDDEDEKGGSERSGRKKSSKNSASSKRNSGSKSSDRKSSSSSSSSNSSSKKDDDKNSNKKSESSSTSSSSKQSSSKSTKSEPEAKESASDDSIDVDCLIDPSKCKKSGKKSESSKKKSKPAVDPSLPEKLNASSIHGGINKVKAAAMKCGKQHGASPGSKVPVRISVAGATGKVVSAKATGEYAGKALGKCVAAQAKKAKFPRFQQQQQGFAFRFKM